MVDPKFQPEVIHLTWLLNTSYCPKQIMWCYLIQVAEDIPNHMRVQNGNEYLVNRASEYASALVTTLRSFQCLTVSNILLLHSYKYLFKFNHLSFHFTINIFCACGNILYSICNGFWFVGYYWKDLPTLELKYMFL